MVSGVLRNSSIKLTIKREMLVVLLFPLSIGGF